MWAAFRVFDTNGDGVITKALWICTTALVDVANLA